MSGEVFRFMAIRPPQAPADTSKVVRLQVRDDSRALQPLTDVLKSGEDLAFKRSQIRALARMMVAKRAFQAFARQGTKKLRQMIRDAEGRGGPEQIKRTLTRTKTRIGENLVVAVIAGQGDSVVTSLADMARVVAAAEARLDDKGSDGVTAGVRQKAPIVIESALLTAVSDPLPQPDEEEDGEGDLAQFRKPHFGPVGIGDLMLVEQRLLRYEAGEIAHIENVMRSEFRERSHRALRRTEDVTVEETEEKESSEEDLHTAERFELQRETNEEIKERSEDSNSLSLTGSYGPMIEVTANISRSSSDARTESTRRSSTYAQDVISRSVSKVEERVRRERRRTVIHEVEDINIHRFDNAGGSEHSVGIYQFVDKVYEARLVNYGQRLLFEFFIPEPASWLKWAQRRQVPKGEDALQPPKPPSVGRNPLRPEHITLENYATIAADNGVADVPLPPAKFKTVSHAVSNVDTGEEGLQRVGEAGTIALPDGYHAREAWVTAAITSQQQLLQVTEVGWTRRGGSGDSNAVHLRAAVGSREPKHWWTDRHSPGHERSTENIRLDGETGEVPYYIQGYHDEVASALIVIKCERTDDFLEAWKADVYRRIMETYEQRLVEYREAQANAAFTAPVVSRLPAGRLRDVERDELKRRCIELLEPDDFPGPSALSEGTLHPVLNRTQLEILAPRIRFFEQAFEWAHMAQQYYPYFWTQARDWADLALTEHGDEEHARFLRAGAARVIVPVRLGYNGVVQHFLATGGDILDEAEAPMVSSDTWLPIALEIAEQTGRPDPSATVVDCWEVRVPTALVTIAGNEGLPSRPRSDDCPSKPEDG